MLNLELLKENVTHIGSYRDTDVFPLYVTVDDYEFEITNEGEVNDENIDSASGGGKKGLTVEEVLEYVETAKQEAIQKAVQQTMDEMNENTKSIETKIDETKNNLENKINDEKTNIKGEVYPVGSIYISISATNPGTLFGGTWERYGKGRTLVSVDEGQTEFSKVQNTGGAKTVALAIGNLPSHSHSIPALSGTTESAGSHNHTYTADGTITSTFTGSQVSTSTTGEHRHNTANYSVLGWPQPGTGSGFSTGGWSGSSNPYTPGVYYTNYTGNHSHTVTAAGTVSSKFSGKANQSTSTTGSHSHKLSTDKSTTGNTGSGTAFSVLNPYITVYIWRRTA